jgi:DNA-binding NarL/FixJ family response regulator
VAKGLDNRQIADAFYISEGTVKVHLHHVFAKLGLRNRVELTLYVQEKGIAQLQSHCGGDGLETAQPTGKGSG